MFHFPFQNLDLCKICYRCYLRACFSASRSPPVSSSLLGCLDWKGHSWRVEGGLAREDAAAEEAEAAAQCALLHGVGIQGLPAAAAAARRLPLAVVHLGGAGGQWAGP